MVVPAGAEQLNRPATASTIRGIFNDPANRRRQNRRGLLLAFLVARGLPLGERQIDKVTKWHRPRSPCFSQMQTEALRYNITFRR
jgi:hypothetical protein